MSWTDERVETLIKLWTDGLSASQIATQLGGVTRNAVIGKVHRLKLSGRAKVASGSKRAKKTAEMQEQRRRAAARTASAAPITRTVTTAIGNTALKAEISTEIVARAAAPAHDSTDSVVVPMSRELTLTDLNESTCKWPIGDPMAEDFNFCGNGVKEGCPYCAYHAKLAFQPASDRRRPR